MEVRCCCRLNVKGEGKGRQRVRGQMPGSQVAAGLDGLGYVGLEVAVEPLSVHVRQEAGVVNLEHMARNRKLGVTCTGVLLICVSKSNAGHGDIKSFIHLTLFLDN